MCPYMAPLQVQQLLTAKRVPPVINIYNQIAHMHIVDET